MSSAIKVRTTKFLTRKISLALMLLGSALLSFGSQADEASEISSIRSLLTATQPGMLIEAISASPIAGLYEVVIQNGQAIYVSSDAQFLIPGDLFQVGAEGLVNLGEGRRNALRKSKIAALDEADMIVFPALPESKATITVFTDVDCPYCRKLHGEIVELNAMGITVRYLAYPRTGLNTETHQKMVNVWCGEDRKALFTLAKRGGEVPQADCDDPVAEHYKLGQLAGVTGTPALVFEDGSIVPGYVPAATLYEYLFNK